MGENSIQADRYRNRYTWRGGKDRRKGLRDSGSGERIGENVHSYTEREGHGIEIGMY